MKLSKILGALTTALFLSNTQAAVFYDGTNFNGTTMVGFPNTVTTELGDFQDRISSLNVFQGECVLLAEDYNFGGDILIYGPGTYSSLSPSIDNRTTAIMVFPGPDEFGSVGQSYCENAVAYLYDNSDRTGARYPAPAGIANNDIRAFNDKASSIFVPDGVCVIAYQDTGFSGYSEVLLPGAQLFQRNDFITSYVARPTDTPLGLDACNF